MNHLPAILAVVAITIFTATLAYDAGYKDTSQQSEPHKTLVKKGYGQYCPTNGKFAFVGECPDQKD